MLDVHAPEHRIHGIRDFLIHLLTITIGLLIALGLEAGVEVMHHRHQRKEAEATIRQELLDNQKSLVKMQHDTWDERSNLKKALVFLEDLCAGKKGDPSGFNVDFNVSPLSDAAWRTASATGALSYMSYADAQRFAVAYHEQQLYEDTVAISGRQFELLGSYFIDGRDPRTLTAPDIEAAIPDLRQSIAGLNTMSDLGRGTLITYDHALKP